MMEIENMQVKKTYLKKRSLESELDRNMEN